MANIGRPVVLSPPQREALSRLASEPKVQARHARRARMVLLVADGMTNQGVADRVGCPTATVSKWRTRSASEGLDGLLDDFHPGRPPKYDLDDIRTRVEAEVAQGPARRFRAAEWTAPRGSSGGRATGPCLESDATAWHSAPTASVVVRVHRCRVRQKGLRRHWLDSHSHAIRLDYLPPYSPELDHIERVWKLTRCTCTRNRYFSELNRLLDAVFEQLSVCARPNAVLRRLCAVIGDTVYGPSV